MNAVDRPSPLVKATLTHLTTLERFTVLWNPARYRVSATARLAAAGTAADPASSGAGGERFSARLFLEASENQAGERDLRPAAGRLESWMEIEAASGSPPQVLFAWGPFRFRGVIESLDEEWVLFDPDGTPVRGWIDITLRKRTP